MEIQQEIKKFHSDIKINPEKSKNCSFTIYFQEESIEFFTSFDEKLFLNKELYSHVFQSSDMKVEDEDHTNENPPFYKLTIIPLQKKGEISTITYLYKKFSITTGNSYMEKKKEVLEFLKTKFTEYFK